MNAKSQPLPGDPDWSSLLQAERELEAQIAAAEAQAHGRVAQARAAAASALPDPAAAQALAAAQEQADIARQRRAIEFIDAQVEQRMRALAQLSDAQIETLAQLALDAVLDEQLAVRRP